MNNCCSVKTSRMSRTRVGGGGGGFKGGATVGTNCCMTVLEKVDVHREDGE
jgi:hypothetical protein